MAATGALAAEPYTIQPVQTPGQVRPLPATAWPPPEAASGEMLMKLAYLRGLMDALQYAEVAPQAMGEVLTKLKGLNLHELAAEVDSYYLADPKRRSTPPASVVLTLLPHTRGKLETSPIPRGAAAGGRD